MADSTDCKTYDYASAANGRTPGPWNAAARNIFDPKGARIAVAEWIGVGGTAVARANAKLIAAAPDLLMACKALQMEAASRDCGLRIADEAIAKAEGL